MRHADKLMHAGAGALAAAAVYVPTGDIAAAMIAVALVAVAREVYNRYRGGPFDGLDIAATIVGGLCVVARGLV